MANAWLLLEEKKGKRILRGENGRSASFPNSQIYA
jgi:hypothetical protein